MNLHNIWSHRWTSPRSRAKMSPIHGTGVFAEAPISKGEIVAALGGVIVPAVDIERFWRMMGQVGIQIEDTMLIVPTSRAELERCGVFNHSCNPNIGFSTSITLVAIRDINKGEELTFDYAFSETYYHGFECNCGHNRCRRHVTGRDWERSDLRTRYFHYFSPYLRDKIAPPDHPKLPGTPCNPLN